MEPTTANAWCEALDITPPKLSVVAGHPEANTFALLLVALLECGAATTLLEVAARFEKAGIAERSRGLLSLQPGGSTVSCVCGGASSTTCSRRPGAHRDEETLYELKQSAITRNVPLEVVVGSAPGWEEPWSRGRLAYVVRDSRGWRSWLVDQDGVPIDEAEVQRARLPVALH